MEPPRRDSGPPLPPGPGGALPILLAVGLVLFLLAGFLTIGTVLEWRRAGSAEDPVNLLLAGLAVFPLTIFVGLRLDPGGFETLRGGMGVRPTRPATALLALLFGLALVLPLAEADNLLQYLRPMSDEERAAMLRLLAFDDWSSQIAKVFAIAVVTPIGEELIFRGIVLRWLRRSYGRFVGIGVSALLFALAHLSLRRVLPILALGVAFGWIADRSRSALPTIGAHAAFNAVPFLVPPGLDAPGFEPAEDPAIEHLPALWVVTSAAACLVLLYAIWWTTLRRD